MTLTWVITGSILEAILAMFLFMLAIFNGAGRTNKGGLSKSKLSFLDRAIFILPALCFISLGIVIYLYNINGSTYSYYWYAMPLIATVFYFKLN